ncbi:hypothetical protein ACFLWL_01420 [Chloroflexota bacterium]
MIELEVVSMMVVRVVIIVGVMAMVVTIAGLMLKASALVFEMVGGVVTR